MANRWAANVLTTCLGLRPGENLLVIVDEPLGYAREALSAEARRLGAGQVKKYMLPVVPRPLSVVPPGLAEDARTADVIISLFSALNLRRERPEVRVVRAAFQEAGRGRWAYGAQVDEETIYTDLVVDYEEVARRVDRVAESLSGADQVRIVTEAGTDLTFRIGGRPIYRERGIYREPGAFGNLPGGEVFVAPLEESAEGRLVVDASLGDLRLREPVTLHFRQGHVVLMGGGAEAQELMGRLGDDPLAWAIGEFGIGANPGMPVRGRVTGDEKALGTIHIALGSNQAFGGANTADSHYDCVVRNPQIFLDHGRLLTLVP